MDDGDGDDGNKIHSGEEAAELTPENTPEEQLISQAVLKEGKRGMLDCH